MRRYLVAVFVLLFIFTPFSIVAANGGSENGGSGSDNSAGDGAGSDDSGGSGNSGSDDRGGGDSVENGTGKDNSGRSQESVATDTISPEETVTGRPMTTADKGKDETRGQEITNVQVKIKEVTPEKLTDVTVLKVKIKQREAEIEQELHAAGVKDHEILQNQSSFLVGIQAFKEVNELVSVNGANITRIEAELRQSFTNTTQAEVRIKERNQLIRFFIGGDESTAHQILQDLGQNQDRIREMEQLIDQCSCTQEVGDVLREQLRDMAREQERLEKLAFEEINDTGLIGLIWEELPFSPFPAGTG